jgi:hypothetical protein
MLDNVEILLGAYVQVSHLVALVKDGIQEAPLEPSGKPMTADHIEGREDHPFPHRFENIRWASRATQMENRVCK